MNHAHLDELLSVYLDGEGTRAEVEVVEAHLAECLRCRRRLADVNVARSAVRSLPLIEMPPGTVPPTEQVSWPRRRTVWMGAAAAVAALVMAVAALTSSGPEPLDIEDVSLQLDARSSLDVGAVPLKVVLPSQERE